MIKKWKKRFSLLQKQLLLILYYSTKIKWTFSKSEDKKKIIICFDGLFSHGGLVDRLKGIISFYEVAKKLDYDFYIYFKHPFELTLFLKPNKISWEISKEQLRYNLFESKVIYLMNNFSANPISLIENCKAKTVFVYCNIDYLGVIYNDKKQEELDDIWKSNYNDLFSVSDLLQDQINQLPSKKGIVFHSRFTSLMGDFKDSTSFSLEIESRQKLIFELIKIMKKKSLSYPDKKIYVLSDSIFFLNYIKEHTSFNVLSGTPKHIDVNNNEMELTSHIKTFTDFYFMSKCDGLYLLKLNQMHASNFSKYAGILGKVPFAILKNDQTN